MYAILRSAVKHSLGQFNIAPVLDLIGIKFRYALSLQKFERNSYYSSGWKLQSVFGRGAQNHSKQMLPIRIEKWVMDMVILLNMPQIEGLYVGLKSDTGSSFEGELTQQTLVENDTIHLESDEVGFVI